MIVFYRDLPGYIRDLIVARPEVLEAVWCWDCALYDAIFQTLLPDVYAAISYNTYRDICLFTQHLQQDITIAMGNAYPERLVQQKCGVAGVFVTKVKRHLNLNQVVQVASVILSYPYNLGVMLKDWESIDFNTALDQALWLLRTNAGIERWIGWVQTIIEKHLNGALRANKGKGYCIFYARQLVVKWSYYMTIAVKELTFNNASSCDHFTKLQHFLDDMIQYHVECFLAKTNWSDILSGYSSAANQIQDVFSDGSAPTALRPNTPKSMQREPK
ncbi:hypothetical protein BX666DRAFT_220940 [Dichotomocladium elegans]|nr:hypothetical protein BX666DRAFT_220940 [Dichotomocladium elegans]